MARVPRIAIVTPRVLKGEGQGRVNYEIAAEAASADFDVTVVTTLIETSMRTARGIRVATWERLKRISSTTLRSEIGSLCAERWLRKNRSEIDIIHINGAFSVAPSDVNTVHFVHRAYMKSGARGNDYGVSAFLRGLLLRWNAGRERIAFGNARLIVAVSNRVRDEIIDMGFAPGRIEVIRNGVDVTEFYPGSESRLQLGIPEQGVVFLFAGDLTSPRKNLDGVLRAIANVPNVYLVVVGTTKSSIYPKLAKTLGVADRVRFLGYRRDIPNIMRAVDAFVFPSRYEACSLVLLEALASGLPVITAVTAGGAEIVAEANGIVLDDPERTDLLTEAIARIGQDAALRRELGAFARETALRYTWSAMARQYLDVYERLLKEDARETQTVL